MPTKILLVVESPPYGSTMAAECFRIATAMIAMDVLPRMLFMDDGVFCLVKTQSPEQAGLPSFHERLKTLADLTELYVAEESMRRRNLEKTDLDESFNVKAVSIKEAAKLFTESETIITF